MTIQYKVKSSLLTGETECVCKDRTNVALDKNKVVEVIGVALNKFKFFPLLFRHFVYVFFQKLIPMLFMKYTELKVDRGW